MNYIKTKSQIDQNLLPHDYINNTIIPRALDLGGFKVGRVLPSNEKRSIGPFIFWDQAGPGEFLSEKGLDIRPHPHICLSTMTYLFEGRMEHRDTLGSHQIIMPGGVNLMTAGRGIAHSERTPHDDRLSEHRLFGIQCWLALPVKDEEIKPSFSHYDKKLIPVITGEKKCSMRLVAGEWEGIKSPVKTLLDTLFVECKLQTGSNMNIPAAVSEERAIYILSGIIEINNIYYPCGRMLILKNGCDIKIKALNSVHFIILGGASLEQPRYLWWNFVASSKERIEQAKDDWKEGRFGVIPSDDKEFTPLPL